MIIDFIQYNAAEAILVLTLINTYLLFKLFK